MVISKHARNSASRCALACVLASATLGASPAFAVTSMPPVEVAASQDGVAISAAPKATMVNESVEAADADSMPVAQKEGKNASPATEATQPEAASDSDATLKGEPAVAPENPADAEANEELETAAAVATAPGSEESESATTPEAAYIAPDPFAEQRLANGEADFLLTLGAPKQVTVISPEPSKVVLKEDPETTTPKPQPTPNPETKPNVPTPVPPSPSTPSAPVGKFVEMEPTPEANNAVVQRSKISCSESTNAASAECDLARRLPADKPIENVFVLKWDADDDSDSTDESLEMTVPVGEKLNNFQLLLAPPSLASGTQATESLTLELRDENGKTETVILNTPQLKLEAAAGRMEPLAYPLRPSEVAPSLGPIRSITFLPGAKSQPDGSGGLNVDTNVHHDPFGGTKHQIGMVLAGLVTLPELDNNGGAQKPSTDVDSPKNPGNTGRPNANVQAGGTLTGATVPSAMPSHAARVQRPVVPEESAPLPELVVPVQNGLEAPRGENLGGEPAPVTIQAPGQDQTLNAVNFTPAALEPSLVALLQAAGISLALIGSFSLITAEERRRRR